MRPENQKMRAYLLQNGIDAMPKYILDGSLKHTWRIYNSRMNWTPALAEKLNTLGFTDYRNQPLDWLSGNGGMFSVFVRGHYEFLGA